MATVEARAQWAIGPEVPWHSSVTRTTVEELRKSLLLTTDQATVVDSLYADHEASAASILTVGKEKEKDWIARADAAVPGSPAAFEANIERQKYVSEAANQLAELERTFFDSVEMLLLVHQEEAWLSFRESRRWSKVDKIRTEVPGVCTNLRALVDQLVPTEQQNDELKVVLGDYDITIAGLHEAMLVCMVENSRRQWRHTLAVQKMNERVAAAMAKGIDPYAAGGGGSPRWISEHRIVLGTQVAVRQMNETFASAVAPLLPVEAQDEFWRRFRQSKHPEAYPDRSLAHFFVHELDQKSTLSEAQREAANVMLQDALEGMAEINDRQAKSQEEAFLSLWRKSQDLRELQLRLTAIRQEAALARDEVAMVAIGKIRGLLTTEQKVGFEDMAWLPPREHPTTAPATSRPTP